MYYIFLIVDMDRRQDGKNEKMNYGGYTQKHWFVHF